MGLTCSALLTESLQTLHLLEEPGEQSDSYDGEERMPYNFSEGSKAGIKKHSYKIPPITILS